MKLYKRLLLLIMILTLPQTTLGVSRTFTGNPQAYMVGARFASLGVTNPVISYDINGSFINPASIAGIESMPMAFTSQTVLGVFDYTYITLGFPVDLRLPVKNDETQLQRLSFGLSYGSVMLNGIPNTISETAGTDSVFRAIDYYSSGFNIVAGSVGTSFYDVFSLDELSVGSSLKLTSFIINSRTASTFSFDVGGIGTRYIDQGFLDKISAGAVIQNMIAPPIVDEETGNEGLLPFQIYAGARADMFDELLALYLHNGLNGLALSAEYSLQNNIIVRASKGGEQISAGTGIIFERIAAGFRGRDYSVRFDYNYTQNSAPIDADPHHSISISVLGDARPESPRILNPSEERLITPKRSLFLSGVGPRNTTMRVYNNHSLLRTSISNKFGKWTAKGLPLAEGKNSIFVRSFSLEKDISMESNAITVYSDTTPPYLDIQVLPNGENLDVFIDADEFLESIEGNIGSTVLTFNNTSPVLTEDEEKDKKKIIDHTLPTQWKATIPMPQEIEINGPAPSEMNYLQLVAIDKADNQTQLLEYPFFLSVEFPEDKYVHYKDSVRFIGHASPMVDAIAINGSPVYIDPSDKFAMPIKLDPGKNVITISGLALNNEELAYNLRILRLVTFPDLNSKVKGRREIEFLATLGILDGDDDGKFYPNKQVTRQYVAKLLVLASEEVAINDVSGNLFSDVGFNHPFAKYIQAAVETGLVFAFPDGTFKPDQPLTLEEVIFLLSNAGLIDFEDSSDDTTRYITRRELAEFLAYSPQFELQIEDLIDWNNGY